MGRPTIILIHGAWHGSWCWDDVAEGVRASGFDVRAVDLPGHDQPGSSSRLWNRVSDYVDHVHGEIDQIDGDVVLVGHSMGGLVTQRVLETRSVMGAILLASSPRRGVGGVVARLAKHSPGQVVGMIGSLSLWSMVADDDQVRTHLFTPTTEDAVIRRTGAKLQNESFLAFLSMILRWPRPSKVTTPIQVIAASQDAIFTMAEQRDLATEYGAPLEVIDCGHDVMLEAEWPELVKHIVASAT